MGITHYRFLTALVGFHLQIIATAFGVVTHECSYFKTCSTHIKIRPTAQPMSFFSDSAEYSSSESDLDAEEDEIDTGFESTSRVSEDDENPTIEETPVPMSKNAGNRFVAFVFDRTLNLLAGKSVDPIEMHENRILDTENHVFFCRKTNLYNETFNTDSIADVLWSHQLYVVLVKNVVHAL